MSAIPHIGEQVVIRRPVREREAVRTYPKARVARRRRKAITWRDVARFGMWVCGATLILNLAAGFVGQLLIEETRRAAIRSEQRAGRAELEAAELRQTLDELRGSERIERWASLNGMHSSYLVSNETPQTQ
jgi:hypothetical protein